MKRTEPEPSTGFVPRIALAAVLGATFGVVQAVASRPGASIAGSLAYATAAPIEQQVGTLGTERTADPCISVTSCSIDLVAL